MTTHNFAALAGVRTLDMFRVDLLACDFFVI